MSTLNVGPGQQFSRLSDAVAAAGDGDLIRVQAGTYVNDFTTINKRLTIEGAGGVARFVAEEMPWNDKAVLTTQADVTLRHVEISGARSSSNNGAAIRHENGALVLDRVYFHHNQNGVLAGENSNSSITVLNSEFAYNGAGDGYSHGMYAGKIASLTIRDSYFHDTSAGHEIKSRAAVNLIEDNRILNGGGTASYNIDLPNGGQATVRNNLIHKGPIASNQHTVHFGGEGTPYESSKLVVSGNTVVNERGGGQFVLNQSGAPAEVTGNNLFGLNMSDLLRGAGSATGNTALASRPSLDTTPVGISGAPAPVEPPPSSGGSGSEPGRDVLTLYVSQDAYQGSAQYLVKVDGVQVGGIRTASANHALGETEAVVVEGNFGSGRCDVEVSFLNDAYDGTPSTDRNLYVDGIDLNGIANPGAEATMFSAGPARLRVTDALPAGPDVLRVQVAEDAYQGHAQFRVAVNGRTVGDSLMAFASRDEGDSQDFVFAGDFDSGQLRVDITFLNDAWSGVSGGGDRNLHVLDVTWDGRSFLSDPTVLYDGSKAAQVLVLND